MSSFSNSGCLLSAPFTPATYTAWCLLRGGKHRTQGLTVTPRVAECMAVPNAGEAVVTHCGVRWLGNAWAMKDQAQNQSSGEAST